MHQLGRLAALRKADRSQPLLDEPGHQSRRLPERTGAEAELGVHERRVPQRDHTVGTRCRVVVDDRRRAARQRLGQLGRVRDRRRREHDLRLRAVDARQTQQPSQHVRDVRSEHAPVDMRLVDHDEPQRVEHVRPAPVVRKDTEMEHVRVREDRVRPTPDPRALLGGGVTVVDRRAQPGQSQTRQRASLILREPNRAARAVSILTLVGAVNVPIVKFSVDWWNTLHQPASVFRLGGPTIHPSMLVPLLVMAVGLHAAGRRAAPVGHAHRDPAPPRAHAHHPRGRAPRRAGGLSHVPRGFHRRRLWRDAADRRSG